MAVAQREPSGERPALGRGIVLLEFCARWCALSAAQAAILERLTTDRVAHVRSDVDLDPALAETHRVTTLPTVLVLKDGAEYARFAGMHPETVFRSAVQDLL